MVYKDSGPDLTHQMRIEHDSLKSARDKANEFDKLNKQAQSYGYESASKAIGKLGEIHKRTEQYGGPNKALDYLDNMDSFVDEKLDKKMMDFEVKMKTEISNVILSSALARITQEEQGPQSTHTKSRSNKNNAIRSDNFTAYFFTSSEPHE
ncbi:hypothetical protein [Helicobacter bizzozeronii]|uniref:hypothetical protein n=1 Tax=Helicobacter bizzozeronii TaxID=56877 RepID=UPI00054F4F91|nr:hypothetical protein [Helicobacter bizzozeronii]